MIHNCEIKSTRLGCGDNGIFMCWLFLEGDGFVAGFGRYALDKWDESLKKRVMTAKGFQAIQEILNTLEIDTWEKLPGTFIRADFDGWLGTCTRIGHLMKDRWFSFKDFFAEEK